MRSTALGTVRERVAGVLLLAILAACTPSGSGRNVPPPDFAGEIVAALEASTAAWNQGDLAGFLEPYLDSPETTFVGSGGLLRGKDEIQARYQSSYWENGAPDDVLRFENIEVRPLGNEHALAVGRYVLTERNVGRETATGIFSLVFARTSEGWKIIHDHSS